VDQARFPKEDHLPDWARRDNKVTQGDSVDLYSVSFFFKKSCRFLRCWKILHSEAGHRWQYGACALHAGCVRRQTDTLRLCNTHCFSTATMVARTRLIVTLYVQCPSCLHQVLCLAKQILLQTHPKPSLAERETWATSESASSLTEVTARYSGTSVSFHYTTVTSLKTANFRHRWDSLTSAIDSLHFPKRHSPVGVGDGTEWRMNWNVCHLDGFRDYKKSVVNKQYWRK